MSTRTEVWRRNVLTASVAALVLAVPGTLALATRSLVLFASLGPTSVMLARDSKSRATRIYAILVSHLGGALCAVAAVYVTGMSTTPSVFTVATISAARLVAALLALWLATMMELRLNATHPPAASTTLLMALGSFRPTVHDFCIIAAGVAAVALTGELLRHIRRAADPS